MTRLNRKNNRVDHNSCLLFLLPLLLTAFSVGCGGSSTPDCGVAVALFVAPASGTADHLAASPGNKVQFVGGNQPPAGCPPPPVAIRTDLKWTVSDPANVTIGNTQGVDYGVATCNSATAGAVTVTATGANIRNAPITGMAALTCK